MLLRAAAALAVALALAGCGGGGSGGQTTSGLAPGCGPADIEQTVSAFLAAISSGDRAAIDRRLSPAGDFVRLTVVELDLTRFTTASRARALDYLVARHARGERQRLLRLQVARGVDANHDTVAGAMTRVAADTGRSVAVFDGAVDCVRGSITRWRLRPSS